MHESSHRRDQVDPDRSHAEFVDVGLECLKEDWAINQDRVWLGASALTDLCEVREPSILRKVHDEDQGIKRCLFEKILRVF